jgi:regulator of protease activity HflC (stomatin/prohibitin superfamily)
MATQALKETTERTAQTMNGGVMLLVSLVALALGIWLLIAGIRTVDDGGSAWALFLPILLLIVASGMLAGFYTLQPNEAAAITLFDNYKGTDRTPGLRWVLPWFMRKKISVRVHNVTGEKLKVNDRRGNPIEIAAVVVWRVSDTASALFDVDDYKRFVDIQIETAVREIASHFAYDNAEHDEPTLRAASDQVSALLQEKLQERVSIAGVVIDGAKLSHLAYAPEIASAMLRRQQAEAVLAARQKIVEGAVLMVEQALNHLSERDVVKLDDERRAAMVSNLLVVLCSDSQTQPVVNAGTIYQ